MSEPDELYTLRAQYWLGHYSLCLDEAKSIARLPMAPNLKIEREEFVLRSYLALGEFEKVLQLPTQNEDHPGIKAIKLRAKYDAPSTPESTKTDILSTFQQLLADPSSASSTTLQLMSSQIYLNHGDMTKEALECVHMGSTMEHLAMIAQIYISIDRLDLANQQLNLMKQADEEAILTQLCAVYVYCATGRSQAGDAIHLLGSLSEQYGPSLLLRNCTAVANMICEKYDAAEAVLLDVESSASEKESVDTLINLVVCYQHQEKDCSELLSKLKALYPSHPFVEGLGRVEGAFEREAQKYKTVA